MLYPIIGIVVAMLAVAAIVWWSWHARGRTAGAPVVAKIRDRTAHHLDRLRRAGL